MVGSSSREPTPSITSTENILTKHAKTLGSCTLLTADDIPVVPSMSCNRAVVSLQIPAFFKVENWVSHWQGHERNAEVVLTADCLFRSIVILREKEAVVQRIDDSIKSFMVEAYLRSSKSLLIGLLL